MVTHGDTAARAASKLAWGRAFHAECRTRGILSPAELARRLDCTRWSASALLAGETMPGKTLPQIAALLGLSEEETRALGQEPPRDTSQDEWVLLGRTSWHRIVAREADGTIRCGCGHVFPAGSRTARTPPGRVPERCGDTPAPESFGFGRQTVCYGSRGFGGGG